MTPQIQALHAKLASKEWRMENLYLILTEDGAVVPFKFRTEQDDFRRNCHSRNFIAKGRKLGMSTYIVLDNGDECLFNKNFRAGIIDLAETDAFDKLGMFKFALDQGIYHPNKDIATLWKAIHKANPLSRETVGRLEWANGSSYAAGTSYVGKTPQRLHISEYGPISAEHPKKATKIKKGSINAVPPNGRVDIETTMEGGQFGECYLLFQLALENEGKELSKVDWKLHFFPWLEHPSYVLENRKPHRAETIEYFAEIKAKHGIDVPLDRQAWYEAKKREQQEEMFLQFPTVIEELSRVSVPGQIYPQMTALRAKGRVKDFEPENGCPVFTCWDLGSSDNTAGWVVQPAGKDHNFLDWCCGEGQGAAGVAKVIRAWEEIHGPFAGHFIPHDANITDKGSGKTYVSQLVECGIPREKITVVPRIPDIWVGIDEVRQILPNCWFHVRADQPITLETGAKLPGGVGRLQGYRKRIDNSTSIARDVPVKDYCDHTADALRTYAEALSKNLVRANVVKSGGGARVVTGFRGATLTGGAKVLR